MFEKIKDDNFFDHVLPELRVQIKEYKRIQTEFYVQLRKDICIQPELTVQLQEQYNDKLKLLAESIEQYFELLIKQFLGKKRKGDIKINIIMLNHSIVSSKLM